VRHVLRRGEAARIEQSYVINGFVFSVVRVVKFTRKRSRRLGIIRINEKCEKKV
jgi:hypothetical protein